MAVLSGGVTARRYHVIGDVPEGWRATWRRTLAACAFKARESKLLEPRFGFVHAKNMLEADFDDIAAWVAEPWVVLAVRVDTPVIPERLVRATLLKRCREWCLTHGRERVPRPVKKDIREQVLEEIVRKMLPRTQMHDMAWNTRDGVLLFGTHAGKAQEYLAGLFEEAFAPLRLRAWDPLRVVTDDDARRLDGLQGGDYAVEGRAPPPRDDDAVEPEASDDEASPTPDEDVGDEDSRDGAEAGLR